MVSNCNTVVQCSFSFGSILPWRHCDTQCTSGFMDNGIFVGTAASSDFVCQLTPLLRHIGYFLSWTAASTETRQVHRASGAGSGVCNASLLCFRFILYLHTLDST